ncbi:MAG: hypothetical protein JO131_01855, partial [Gammaproteobacteria bacterium]|nr:hypothetical protein [Gammaproteobacteria bacterium]
MFTKIRNKVLCDCKKCNGKFVEERTRKSHTELEQCLEYSVSGFVRNKCNKQAHTIPEIDHGPVAGGSSSSKKRTDQEGPISFDSSHKSNFDVLVPQKRRRKDQFREPEVNQHENPGNDESNRPIDEYEDEGDMPSEDDETPVEQFIAPENDLEFEYPDTNVNLADSWILIWIFKYQARFRLSDVAIDSLIKFFQQMLTDADQMRFKDFPSSLHTASKLLQLGNQSKTYAACPKCNTLYNIADIVAEKEFKCTHVEFPMKSKGNSCGMELTEQVPLTIGNKRRPKLLFPLLNLKIQINSLYQQTEFK